MKRILVIIVCALVSSASLKAQVLKKGNIDTYLGVGFGYYTLNSNLFENETSAVVPGLINLGAAYQITDGFALGLDYERNGFVTNADSNNKAVSQNFGLRASYNVLNKEKNALKAFIVLGTSTFRFDDLDTKNYAVSRGSQFQIGGEWKHYFGGKLGMFLNFSIPFYSYNEFKDEDGDVWEDSRLNGTVIETRVVQIKMNGVNFRTGITFKFGG